MKGNNEEAGSHGWHIVKFHVMSMMTSIYLKFECAKFAHGSAGEKNQKWFVKRMGVMAKMRLDLIASQVVMNYFVS